MFAESSSRCFSCTLKANISSAFLESPKSQTKSFNSVWLNSSGADSRLVSSEKDSDSKPSCDCSPHALADNHHCLHLNKNHQKPGLEVLHNVEQVEWLRECLDRRSYADFSCQHLSC